MPAFETHLILVKPWQARLTILIGGTRDEIYAALRKRRVHLKDAESLANYCRDHKLFSDGITLYPTSNPSSIFIYFPKRPNQYDPNKVDTIAHELMHVTFALLKRCAVRRSEATEEAYAHTLGQLMGEFWTRVFPRQPKRPKCQTSPPK